MSRSARSNATKPAKMPIPTTGETFDDGAAIELVRGSAGSSKPNLLLWNGSVCTIGPTVEYRGRIYEAPEIPASIYRGVLLPSGREDGGSVRELLNEITAIFRQVLLADREPRLLAAFGLVTWFADRSPIAPGIEISGPDQAAGVEVLRLLRCFCRHPLLLAEVTPGNFRSLPLQLSLTLLLNQQELKPAMKRLLRTSSYRGIHLPGNRGSVVDPYGPKAVFCGGEPGGWLGEGSIRISMALAQFSSNKLDEMVYKKIADRFQPRLLHLRLTNCAPCSDFSVDARAFTSETRRLAGALGACIPQDPEFGRELVELLRPQDEEAREERFFSVEYILVEVLWGLIHHRTEPQITVAKLAKKANALLRSRGEVLSYGAEEIGWRLRALGITRHTTSAGRQVLFDRDNRRRVHSLARAYELPCAQVPVRGCAECEPNEAPVSS